jgi:hypothetical protein
MAKSNSHPSALDRVIQSAIGDERVLGREDDPCRTRCPELWDWLSRHYVGRDRVKTPAVLTIRLGPEGCLATLTDRDLSVSIDVACPHVEDVFAALEAALTSDCPPVKSWGKKEPQLRKRRTIS